jgi:hypothetical protein
MVAALVLIAVSYAALCVWLTVRIVNRRERRDTLALATLIAAPIVYVMSFGPACWLGARQRTGDRALMEGVYGPLIETAASMPDPIPTWICHYATCGMPADGGIMLVRGKESDRFTILSKGDFRLLTVGRRKSNTTRVTPPIPPDAAPEYQ